MRSEAEVQAVYDSFDAVEGGELLASKGDNFKYGFWVGKAIALGWVLGEPIADLKIHHDFESWVAEQQSGRGQ